jgi:hypothetical protein
MVHTIEMSDEETFKMYSKLKKEDIIKMLMESNKQLNEVVVMLGIYSNIMDRMERDK